MSYCRFSDRSDVYMYEGRDGISCCGCALDKRGHADFDGPEAALAHLEAHVAAGHKVPEGALECLRVERAD